jgi:hypothetical protein
MSRAIVVMGGRSQGEALRFPGAAAILMQVVAADPETFH